MWNASEGGLAGVKGWAVKNTANNNSNEDTYMVYYGCDGRFPALPNTCENLFKDFTNLQEIEGLNDTITSNVTSMRCMFDNCKALQSVNLTNLNTSKVTRMDYMFNGCSNLTSLDVTKFDTKNVVYMNGMFNGCSNLTSLDVTKFDTKNVVNMNSMFDGCKSLTSLDVTKFNANSVTRLNRMFQGCSKLSDLDLSSFKTGSLTEMYQMFYGCSGLTNLDLSGFNTSKVDSMNCLFFGCKSLTSLNVSKFDTSNVSNFASMFNTCSNLENLDVTNFNTGNATTFVCLFANCTKLNSINISNFNSNNVKSMYRMFYCCTNLTEANLSNFNTTEVSNMEEMFYSCNNLTKLDISSFELTNTSISKMMKGAMTKCSTEAPGEIKILKKWHDKFIGSSGIDTDKIKNGEIKITDVETEKNTLNSNFTINWGMADNDSEVMHCENSKHPEFIVNSDEPYAPDETSNSEENTTNNNDSGIQKAYGDEIDSSNQEGTNSSYGSVPEQYSKTVNAGTFSDTVKEITFSLKAINYGNYGTSGKITVTDTIPSGLKYVTDSIKSYQVRRLSPDSGGLNGNFVEGQEPAYADGKITFAVEGLSAGAQLEVTFKCELESTPTGYTQFVNFANYETKQFSGASNYATAEYGTKPTVYTNTFSNTGEEGNVPPNAPKPETLSYAEGATVTLPKIPIIEGYTATRKVTKASGGDIIVGEDNTFIMPGENVTTTITWAKNETTQHKVTFTFGSEESKYPPAATSLLPADDKHTTGIAVSVPIIAEDSYSGWKFTGWTAESSETNKDVEIVDGKFTMPGADVVVTGTWKKNAYSIILAKGTGPDPEDVKLPEGYPIENVAWGSTCDWPEDAKYTGTTGTKYKFNGWSATPSLTNTEGKFTMPMQDVSFTATWNPVVEFTVTFNEKGHGKAPDPITVDEGDKITEPVEPTETGYIFGGWYKETECTNVWDFATDKVVENTTLYAKWTTKNVEVTFNHNDGETPTTETKMQTYDANYTFPADPTRAGYNFTGWYDAKEGGTEITTSTKVTSEVAHTLFAHWVEKANVTISYSATTGGSVDPTSESVAPATGTTSGSTATASAGYHFVNWTDAGGKVVSTDSKFVPQKSEAGIYETAAYTANFDIDKFIITFDSNGGSSVDPVEVESGQTIEKPTTTKEGFNFVNWFEKIDEETIADDPWDFSVGFTKNTTLIAKWSEITPVIEDPTAKVDEKSLDEVLKAKQQEPEYKDKALDIVFDIKQDAAEGDKEAITKYIEQNEIKSDNVEYHEAILTMFIDKNFDNPVDIGDDNNELITASYTFDFNKKENIHVIRNHEYAAGTKAEELTEAPNEFDEYVTFDKTNNQIIVVAKKYSAYSVSYTNIADPTPEPEPTLPNNNSVDAASTSSTGDSAPIVPIATTMFIALGACVGLRRRLTN